MSLIDLLLLLLVAGICGSIARSLVGFSRGGCFASILLGFIGALVGTWLARAGGLPEFFPLNIGGRPFPVVWSVLGAALFSAALSLISRGLPKGES